MRIRQASPATRRRGGLGWAAACALLLVPVLAFAQATLRPAEKPLVTAESETWYLAGEPITFSGAFYYPAGAQRFFEPNEMVRSGSYRGIPLYTLATREPYSVLFVPVDRGLMQPYERPRSGEVAGTVGTTAPSFPVQRDMEGGAPAAGLQAAAPPILREYAASHAPTDDHFAQPAPAGTSGLMAESGPPAGPLTTAQRPTGLNAFYIEYQGERWYSAGKAVPLDIEAYEQSGEYRGFPVYVARGGAGDMIYVAVAGPSIGLVTPYSTRK